MYWEDCCGAESVCNWMQNVAEWHTRPTCKPHSQRIWDSLSMFKFFLTLSEQTDTNKRVSMPSSQTAPSLATNCSGGCVLTLGACAWFEGDHRSWNTESGTAEEIKSVQQWLGISRSQNGGTVPYQAIFLGVYPLTSSTRTRRGGSCLRFDYRTFFIYRTCMRRAPCVCPLCELVVLLFSKNVTGVRPRWHATSSEHFLHTSHCSLWTRSAHSTPDLMSNHWSLLTSCHLTSTHPILSINSADPPNIRFLDQKLPVATPPQDAFV